MAKPNWILILTFYPQKKKGQHKEQNEKKSTYQICDTQRRAYYRWYSACSKEVKNYCHIISMEEFMNKCKPYLLTHWSCARDSHLHSNTHTRTQEIYLISFAVLPLKIEPELQFVYQSLAEQQWLMITVNQMLRRQSGKGRQHGSVAPF